MKRGWLFGIAVLFIQVQALAQGVGVEAGLSLNNIRASYDGNTATTGFRPAVRAGVIAQERISNNFSFQYGVFYNAKGGALSFRNSYDKNGVAVQSNVKGYLRADYIELPLAMVYHRPLKNDNSLFFGAGPYIGLAFGGIVALDEEVRSGGTGGFSLLYPATIGDDSDYDDFRMVDLGLGAFVGYELRSGFFGKVNATYGLRDVHPSSYFTLRNYNFALTIGYMIR